MKLLIESRDSRRSMNGGEYAKGYALSMADGIVTVVIDRCYGSDYEGEYIHEYELPGLTLEQAEALVQANPEAFVSQCNGKAVAALLHQLNS